MMKYFFIIFAILSFTLGIAILSYAKGAIHEIESFILFVIFAIFSVGYGILDKIEKLEKNS
mgnify:CR=1 FL=1